MWESGEADALVLNLGVRERTNYGSCWDGGGNYDYDGSDNDDEDDEKK